MLMIESIRGLDFRFSPARDKRLKLVKIRNRAVHFYQILTVLYIFVYGRTNF